MIALAARDCTTMLRRNLLHLRRYPGLSVFPVLMPIVFLLLFVFVLGGTLGDGLGTGTGGRGAYLEFVVPGMLVLTIAGAAQITAISVAKDMTEGIVARFKTMRIWHPAVLAGHVGGTLVLAALALVAFLAVAVAIGYRPAGSPRHWLAAAGLLAALAVALIWLCVGMGVVAKSVETASNMPMVLILLPFFGSGFVPADSLPGGLRWFAEHQPFTPVIDSLRHLLAGEAAGTDGWLALGWSAVIRLAAFAWARRRYGRRDA